MEYLIYALTLVQGFALSGTVTGIIIYLLRLDRTKKAMKPTGIFSATLILVSLLRIWLGTRVPRVPGSITSGLFLAGALIGAFTTTQLILRDR